ncbi:MULTISPECIES: hypothetical protein [Vagococcus]|uniref:hypothetical protein n=1 Tax=Vagococcus TaxID=2737 RepID=UPI000E50CBE0|nr:MULTISPECIES: hypothetical protein [Vagococcus]RHH70141.1 hypothetical protein DW196_05090 [Vagococcus sp. AM17-17]
MTKELSSLNEVYQTIAKVTSLDDVLRLYQEFKGLTITFPTKLISADYVKPYLKKETQKGQQLWMYLLIFLNFATQPLVDILLVNPLKA